ncbi:MAG: HD domain-containing protein [Tissierellia bacterium]|nr:HD domain-containing protein [Tissierellia bacterium]
MNKRQNLLDEIKKNMPGRRWNHTIGVMHVAEELADIYGADKEAAFIAALFHDCAKHQNHDKLINEAIRYGMKLNDDMIHCPDLIHGPLGAIIANVDYGINDKEILSAIKNHTTGKVGMNLLDQIIFVADFIEPGRELFNIEYYRKLAYSNISMAVLEILNNTIKYLIDSKKYIGSDTLLCRNYFLLICCDKMARGADK